VAPASVKIVHATRLICEQAHDYDPCDGPPDYFHKGGYRLVSPAKLEGMEKSENAPNR
jgi:hypothetical protein